MALRVERIPPRSYEKSKNGCQNCKKRKVKCDEGHPLCGNCARRFPGLLQCFNGPSLTAASDALHAEAVLQTTLHVEAPGTSMLSINDAGGLPAASFQLPRVIEGGLLDPFQTYPATIVPQVDILLRHYLTALVLQSFPFFHSGAVVELWWPFLRGNDVLFHISLYLSARNLEALGGRIDGSQSKPVKSEALRLLSLTIQNHDQVSDQMMVAVANFLTIEHEEGNVKALKTHMNGLKRMVQIRGGLDAIKAMSPMTASIIFWMSMIAANGPHFLPMQFEDVGHEQQQPLSVDSAFARHGVDKKLVDILSDLDQLTAQFSMNIYSTSADEGLIVLGRLSSLLQRLLHLRPALNFQQGAVISESTCYAGALHVLFPLMAHYPDPTLMVNALVHKLKESLVYYLTSSDAVNPVLIWCLAVGGVSAYQMPERSWFIGQLVVAAAELDIQSWHEMRNCLTGVMAFAIFCDNSFRSLWDEVAVKLGFESHYGQTL